MFKHRISADESTDLEAAIADLRRQIEHSSLSPLVAPLAFEEASTILTQFIQNGRKLAALGSQFQATREAKGDGYSISIAFSSSKSKSFFARLLGR